MSRGSFGSRPWKLLAGLAIGAFGVLTPWLVGLSDAFEWQLLPWLLLVLLWAGVVRQLRRRRREAACEVGDIEVNAPAG